MFKREGFPYGMTAAVLALARLESMRGRRNSSAAYFQVSLSLWTGTLSRERLLDTVTGAGLLAARMGKGPDATRLFAFAASLQSMTGYAGLPADQSAVAEALPALRAALHDADFSKEWAVGTALSLDAVLFEAKSLLEHLASMPELQPPGSPDRPAGLTRRELGVLQHIAAGRTNREISEALFISQTTVISHVHNILAKLELDSRSAAAAWAVRHGFD